MAYKQALLHYTWLHFCVTHNEVPLTLLFPGQLLIFVVEHAVIRVLIICVLNIDLQAMPDKMAVKRVEQALWYPSGVGEYTENAQLACILLQWYSPKLTILGSPSPPLDRANTHPMPPYSLRYPRDWPGDKPQGKPVIHCVCMHEVRPHLWQFKLWSILQFQGRPLKSGIWTKQLELPVCSI